MPELSIIQTLEVLLANVLGIAACVGVFWAAGTLGTKREKRND